MAVSARLPVVFFGHGSPANAISDNEATRTWARLARAIGRPKAVLSVSAHWCTNGTAVTAMEAPRTIHDFGRSLPAPLFDVQYPAPGSPALAERVQTLLKPANVRLDNSWGFDHGTWSVLVKAFPQADVPVVQLSMDMNAPHAMHFELGKRLRPLRDEGVLILGTGNIVHNLERMEWNPAAAPYDWAVRFHQYIKNAIVENDSARVVGYESFGGDAALAVPDPYHFWPLLYVLGARMEGDVLSIEPDYIEYKSLSMSSVYLGERLAAA
ncbi:MAG TPA: 4,5-DOPA dioxygenase extradiol [Steroidobacteraceae bacterium]|nr:4,5-DOPA dioxygenase extradiol [Steroidobacteraceae bacterium]